MNKVMNKTMGKAVAVPYLVAIILGVIVIGVVAYWFLTTGVKGSGVTNEAFCKGRLLQFCSDLRVNKITANNDDFYEEYAKECSVYKGRPGWQLASPSAAECKTILGM